MLSQGSRIQKSFPPRSKYAQHFAFSQLFDNQTVIKSKSKYNANSH